MQTEASATTGDIASASGIGPSFDPLGVHLQDPFPFYAKARAEEPVFFAPRIQSWCVARHGDVMEVLRDHVTFSSEEIIPRPRTLPPDFDDMLDWFYGPATPVGFTDEPEHTRIRAVVNTGFTPKAITPFQPSIRRIAAGLIDGLARREEFDVVAEFARPLVMKVVLDFVGIPPERHESLMSWSEQFFVVTVGYHTLDLETLRESKRIFMAGLDYIRSLVEERRAHPRDDMISFLVHGETRGHRLSTEEVVGQVMVLVVAGYETTMNSTANAVEQLLSRPEHWNRVGESDDVTDRLVSECLRYNGPVTSNYRVARTDAKIGTMDVPAGSLVCMLWASANRDAQAFDRPDEFWPERTEESSRNIIFSSGIHYCVGAPLVRVTLRVALSELRRLLPGLQVAPGFAPRYRPISQFRALTDLPVRPGGR
jgi:cytochrome P450